MMYYIMILLLFVLAFIITINKKRVSPQFSENFILSPIDGYISAVHAINIGEDGKLYIEITIKFERLSSPYLYSPIAGEYEIKTNDKDNLIINFKGKNGELITIYHGWSFLVNQFNSPALKKITLHYEDFFKSSESYGIFYFGGFLKIIIDSKNTITASKGQHVIGGESIIACIKNNIIK